MLTSPPRRGRHPRRGRSIAVSRLRPPGRASSPERSSVICAGGGEGDHAALAGRTSAHRRWLRGLPHGRARPTQVRAPPDDASCFSSCGMCRTVKVTPASLLPALSREVGIAIEMLLPKAEQVSFRMGEWQRTCTTTQACLSRAGGSAGLTQSSLGSWSLSIGGRFRSSTRSPLPELNPVAISANRMLCCCRPRRIPAEKLTSLPGRA
jgi:hypothetical protein